MAVASDAKAHWRQGRKILVIEDDTTFATVLADVARAAGFEPVIAARGDVGLVMARQLAPQGIVLDVHMPGLDGWVVLDRLRQHAATRRIPICVMSGNDRRERALRLGAFTFLQKPVTSEEITRQLERMSAFVAKPTKRLLLVDGDPARREKLAAMLAGEDLSIREIASADAPIEACESFDCVVMMPPAGESPAKSVAQLARHTWPEDCPILVFGALANGDRQPLLQRGAGRAFLKSVRSLEEIVDETASYLHRSESTLEPTLRKSLEHLRRVNPRLAGRRALIVDDDPRNVFAMTAMLDAHDMEVIAANSGRAGIDRLMAGNDVDIVLMDIMMPEMDGYETMRAIRAMPAFEALPIIAVTAKAMKGDREQCIAAGATDYIPKPVDSDQLFSLMRIALTA